LRRNKYIIDSDNRINPLNRSGVFSVGGHPEDDGVLESCAFTTLWTGIADIDTITDYLPPSNALVPFYFAESMPFYWSK
jgi:hypothetical protein